MARTIIVDGYNVIRRDAGLARLEARSLELARDVLIDRLNAHPSLRADQITLVFDAARGDRDFQQVERKGRVRIVYSRRGETADEVIKRLVEAASGEVRVITNDRELREHASRHGGTPVRVAPRPPRRPARSSEDDDGYPLRADKKGPARRPKKRDRRPDPYWSP